jgi:hypothetical protein
MRDVLPEVVGVIAHLLVIAMILWAIGWPF